MATTFRPDRAGFDAMAVGPEARRALAEAAGKAKAIAEGLAQAIRVSGDYADSFSEPREDTTTLAGHTRAAVVLTNTSGHAAAVEWGNKGVSVYRNKRTGRFVKASEADNPDVKHLLVDFPAHRVFGRTLDAIGGA